MLTAFAAWLAVASACAIAAPLGALVPAQTGEALGPATAVAGDNVFVGAANATLTAQAQGAVFVYAKPAAGWSGSPAETAVLTTSHAQAGDGLGTSVVTAGPDIVAGDGNGRLDVFAQPAGGWSGEVHETAVLSASDGVPLSNPVVSGNLLVARGTVPDAPGAVYVFSEPAGGWSGVVHQSAKLTASDGTPNDSFGVAVAASGTTVVVGAPGAKAGSNSPGAVYVFTQPPSGWSGSLHQRAKLTASDSGAFASGASFGASVASSGSTIVAALPIILGVNPGAAYVFTEPPGGWKSETQAAKLAPLDGTVTAGSQLASLAFPFTTGTTPQVAISGDTIFVPGARGATEVNPADFIFTKPPGGWSGTQHETGALASSDSGGLGTPVISGQTVIAGRFQAATDQTVVAHGPVYVFHQPAGGWSGTVNETAKLSNPGNVQQPGGEDVYSRPPAGWATGAPSATLVPSGEPASVSLSRVAVSGSTAVADGLLSGSAGPGAAYVFAQPPQGWSTQTPEATLSDPGTHLGQLGISGSTVAALAYPVSGSGPSITRLDVFAEPTGGWTGQVAPAGTLVPSDGAWLSALAINGGTIVAAGYTRDQTNLYVFTEPAGGWSGEIHETARLPLPNAVSAQSIDLDAGVIVVGGVISGTTVAAQNGAYVYTEPAGGWGGPVAAPAALTPEYLDGTLKIYREPAGGWSGTVHPAARLQVPGVYADELAIDGDTVAFAGFVVPGKYDGCPCRAGVWLFSKPASGWSGTLGAPEFVAATSDYAGQVGLALNESRLFAGGQTIGASEQTNLDVFAVPSHIAEYVVRPGKARLQRASLTGLIKGRPRLRFTASAGSDAPPLTALTISLPRGLVVSAGKLRRNALMGVGIVRSVRVKSGKLTISLALPLRKSTLTLGWPALHESAAFHRRLHPAHKGRKHKRRIKLVLTTGVAVTDALGHTTKLGIKTKLVLMR